MGVLVSVNGAGSHCEPLSFGRIFGSGRKVGQQFGEQLQIGAAKSVLFAERPDEILSCKQRVDGQMQFFGQFRFDRCGCGRVSVLFFPQPEFDQESVNELPDSIYFPQDKIFHVLQADCGW